MFVEIVDESVTERDVRGVSENDEGTVSSISSDNREEKTGQDGAKEYQNRSFV
jgi:hypothetical protein